jgi:flagellar capping protein FliD
VADTGGGTAAAFLNIQGTFTSGALNNSLPYQLPVTAVKGVGANLSDLMDRFTNAQTGLLFDASNSIQTQETQLKDRQNSLNDLLTAKKNRLIMQFANLEVTIAQLQSQGNALSSLTTTTSSTTSKTA